MCCKALWYTSCGWYNIYISIPIVVARKSDLLAIRRKSREGLHTGRRTKPDRSTTILGHDPEIIGIGKNDLCLRHIRKTKETGIYLCMGPNHHAHTKQKKRYFLHMVCLGVVE